jgi:hypothetical protein
MQDSKDNSLVKAYNTLWARVTKSGKVKPTMHILDNEASARFKKEIRKNCDLQLVPPDTHWQNLAKRAIKTFKSHFISILAGLDPSFSMTLWDRLLPQTILTLNLLRQAKADPSMSAYQFMHGKFDYNKMPLAPLGCAVQIHESTNRQKSWDVRSLNGWCLGTSDKHYRCYTIYCTKTRAERISNTVFFQHRYLTQPVVTPTDAMIKAMGDLHGMLKKSANKVGMAEIEVLKQLAAIFSGPVEIGTQKPKHVTFAALTALEKPIGPLHEQDTASPRVTETSPRVISAAVVDKPYGPPQPMMTRARAKAQQVALSGQQRWTTNRCCNTDFQAAMSIMEYNLTSETAHAIFDEESGKMLKYRKLINHPKYQEHTHLPMSLGS